MKIGIFTHYYESHNYGGNLQAYALVHYLRNLGYDAEQISYKRGKNDLNSIKISFTKKIVRLPAHILRRMNSKFHKNHLPEEIKQRHEAIGAFNRNIPHSRVINYKNLAKIADEYDAFITGSDQVWHPNAVCDAYLLNFDIKNSKRIAYAASFSVNKIPQQFHTLYAESLAKFNAISVRENKGVEIVRDLIGRQAECVLDPTLLLTIAEWNEVCVDIDLAINEAYMLCFFLGDSELHRKCATVYAKKMNLKIVTLPYLTDTYRKCDETFGDVKLYDISPGQLLSLIKNASYVFCDSFHVTVFSIIFQKNFVTVNRSGYNDMSSRIYTLLSLFDLNERFCSEDAECTPEHIEKLGVIQYLNDPGTFKRQKDISTMFLKEALAAREDN